MPTQTLVLHYYFWNHLYPLMDNSLLWQNHFNQFTSNKTWNSALSFVLLFQQLTTYSISRPHQNYNSKRHFLRHLWPYEILRHFLEFRLWHTHALWPSWLRSFQLSLSWTLNSELWPPTQFPTTLRLWPFYNPWTRKLKYPSNWVPFL